MIVNLKEAIKKISYHKQNSILSASIVLAITFSFSALLGFLRSRFLYAHFFGCCVQELDVYNAAFRLPDLIFKLLVTGALSASFIPVFSSYLSKDEAAANRLASSVVNFLSLIFIGLSLLVVVFTRPLSHFIAGGFNSAQVDLMVNLTRILLIGQVFFLISNFVTGILQVHQSFLIPALSPIVYNLAIIASIFLLAPSMGIYGVVYGVVIGAFLHLAIQIPIVRKIGFKYSFSISELKGVKEIIKLMIPQTLSLGLGEIENTVTLYFATTLVSGSISLFNLAFQVMYLPSRIFGTTVGQASLPSLSRNIAQNELSQFRATVNKTILQSLFIALPITALIIVHRVPIVRIIFGAHNFPWFATLTTAKILVLLTPAIITQAIIQILIRSFYAMHNTKIPLYIAILSLVTTIVTSYYFITMTSLGVAGLAISDSIGNVVQCLGLILLFSHIVDGNFLAITFKKSLKLFAGFLAMIITMWATNRLLDSFFLDTTRTFFLLMLFILSSLIGCITYIAVTYNTKSEELYSFLGYIKRLRK